MLTNSGDPDQMSHSVTFDRGLHCLQGSNYRILGIKGSRIISKMAT